MTPASPESIRESIFPLGAVLWPIEGYATRFPVRRVFCVGKNYADHVAEMGGDAARSTPVIFTKDAACLVGSESEIAFPPATRDLHYETELVVAIGATGEAWGHAVGLDMTRRDLQGEFKAAGQPWDRAKSFADSAPLGAIRPGGVAENARLWLEVNGELRQDARVNAMMWSVEEIVEFLRADMGLGPGDLVFTGTPAGVGAVGPGDRLVARAEGLPELRVGYR